MGRILAAAVAAVSLAAVPQALAKAPVATTGAATSVGATTAVVTGRVDPGGEATSWYVEYGPTAAYGTRTGALSAGNGTGPVDLTEQLRGLTTGITYHFRIVATNGSGTSRGADATFATRAAPAVVTGNPSALGPSSATVGGTVDPNGRSTGWWIEYGTSAAYGSRTDTASAGSRTGPVPVSVRLTGLRAGVTYHFRLVAANDVGTTRGADRSFRTDRGPSVATGGADAITVATARVTGSVDPNGRGTVAWFEYGTSTSLGSRTGDMNAGFGTGSTRIEAQLGGLQPGTRYFYRLVARSDAATTAGATRSLTTSAGPLVTTGVPQVTGVTVVLTGSVDPVGRATSWWFELGPTTSYGSSTVVRSAGSGRGAAAVSETLAGLTPGTEYHARLVARSSAGTTRGADVVFRTAGVPTVGRASAWGISLTRARIGVDVTTNGLASRVWVELTRRGVVVSRSATVAAASSASPTRLSIGLAGLRPGTRYGFRVVAENGAGTATGTTASFGTASRPRDERGRALHCTIVGTNGPDRLVGTRGRDVICGLGGGDVLVGRAGDDVVAGGPGADYLVPGAGRDRVLGGPGNDFVAARGGGADLVFGGAGSDRGRVDPRRDFTQSIVRIA